MSATAKTLKDVGSAMATMNDAIQSQNREANRVLMDAMYSGDWLYITNTGRPTIVIHAIHAGSGEIPPITPPKSLSTGERAQLSTPVEHAFQTALKTRERYVLPVEVELEDGAGNQYIATMELVGGHVGNSGGMSITTTKFLVSQRNWRK
jgi:hypothetical protein